MSYTEITKCRICGNPKLETVLDLGVQTMTGVFPKPGEVVEKSPIVLVKCHGSDSCGLVQIKHSVSLEKMYGDNYGYRSGLNKFMKTHLDSLSDFCIKRVAMNPGDLILDIGSNDGTLLGCYLKKMSIYDAFSELSNQVTLVGMDPTIKKFGKYYSPKTVPIPDFFSADKFFSHFNDVNRKAKIITSISCFYDLEDPVAFAKDIKKVLHPDGVWVLEQSYSLLMLAKNMYDTAVQEHLEYYLFAQIERIMKDSGLHVHEVELNECNGGSIRVVVGHDNVGEHPSVTLIKQQEKILDLNGLSIYRNFESATKMHKQKFRELLQNIKDNGQKVLGLGASTKFNSVLQYCEITPELLPKIGEVNPDKFGCVTPGSEIPIVSEAEVFAENPEYLVVGPYHFKEFLLGLPHVKKYISGGGKLIFPLPSLEIVSEI